jgi:ribonucleoside-diphosphate reductase beta chain
MLGCGKTPTVAPGHARRLTQEFKETPMADKPKQMLLDPGFELTLRPMRYPQFYDMYRNAIKNTWTVEEINFQIDITDLHSKMSPGERHLIHRLVAFFATGDSIVSNNLVLNLYQHSTRPKRACTCRASCMKKRCTCSST